MSFAFFHKNWLKSFTAKLKHRFQIKKLKNVKNQHCRDVSYDTIKNKQYVVDASNKLGIVETYHTAQLKMNNMSLMRLIN